MPGERGPPGVQGPKGIQGDSGEVGVTLSGGKERTVQRVELLWSMKVTPKLYIHFLESSVVGGGGVG